MKFPFRLAASALALPLCSLTLHAAEPGYVDLGKFTPAEGCEYVEINLQPTVLKFASFFVDKDDPAAAALLRSLKRVRVNVVGYNDQTRADTAGHIESVRHELETGGWEQIVTVKEDGRKQNVAIYVKPHGDDSIDGLVVTVLDPEQKQAVFVNLVGNIRPDQVAEIGRSLHIDPLEHLKLPVKSKNS